MPMLVVTCKLAREKKACCKNQKPRKKTAGILIVVRKKPIGIRVKIRARGKQGMGIRESGIGGELTLLPTPYSLLPTPCATRFLLLTLLDCPNFAQERKRWYLLTRNNHRGF